MPTKKKPNAKPRAPYKKRSVARTTNVRRIKQLVKAEIARNIEDKTYTYSTSSSTPVAMYMYHANNLANWDANNVIPISPYGSWVDITQGVTQGTRVGNKIKVKKAILTLAMIPRQYDATVNPAPTPLDVQLFIVNDKEGNTKAQITTDIDAGFFNYGASDLPPSGTWLDMMYEVNKAFFTLKKRMTLKLGYANYGGTGTSAGQQSYANNDYKYSHIKKIDITKFVAKNVVYNDTDSVPTSQSTFLVLNPTFANGSVQYSTNGQHPAVFSYSISYYYEDA